MVKINRILCPVDFSPCARRALEYAVGVGRWYGATVTALHVFANRPVVDAVPLYRGQPLVLEDQDPEKLRTALEQMTREVARGWRVETELLEAPDVQRAITSRADAIGADLIVMGTHGRSGLQHVLLGSVAEKVVLHASCPVLLVPLHARLDTANLSFPFRRIVCAVDFATTSRRAFDVALELAEEADAQLTLVHALEVPPELQVPVTGSEVDVPAVRAAAEADALQRLRALVPAEARTYCHVHADAREGRADRAIVRAAVEREADLIVMGTRHHSAIDRVFFGTNTQGVLRGTPCPVLTVPTAPAARAVGAA